MNEWKLSVGTAGAVGLKKLKTDILPTTAYVMLGERCQYNCAFCAQAKSSGTQSKFLSRVAWSPVDEAKAAASIIEAYQSGQIKRVCLQVINRPNSKEEILHALALLQRVENTVPVTISCNIGSVEQAEEYFAAGAAGISIAMDAATPEVFSRVKSGSWQHNWDLLCRCAARYPGKVATHLIVGLGETEAEMWQLMCACHSQNIIIGLFAFTPLRGTAMATHKPPERGSYRRLQIGLELLRQGYSPQTVQIEDEKIVRVTVPDLRGVLADGRAFHTSGCSDCNRPYYNEKPGEVLYNYHRPLTAEELALALDESGLTEC